MGRIKESWRLFQLFLWKNYQQLRFYWRSLLLITGGCLVVLCIYLHSTQQLLGHGQVVYELRDLDELKSYFPVNEGDFIFYAPWSSQGNALMENVRQELQIPYDALQSFNSSADMEYNMEHECRGNCFGVHFEEFPGDGGGGEGLRYTLSSTRIRVSPKKRYVNDEEISGIKEDDDYLRTGFLTLQSVIDKNYIASIDSGENYDFKIASIPTVAQEYISSDRIITFSLLYSILLNVLLLSTFLLPLVEEKQNGIKEFLIIATPRNFLNGLAFFLIRLLLYVVFTVIILLAAWYFNALGSYVSPSYIVILYLLYILSAMSYTYLISVCFHDVFHAKVCGLVLLIIPYILYHSKGIISSVSNIFGTKTFLEGIQICQIFTNKFHHLDGSELTTNITDSSLNMLSVYAIFIAQCFIYCALYNYLTGIFPGPYGLRKPYLFPLLALFTKAKPRNEYTTNERGNDAIIIQDLKKTFPSPRRVISDNLNMTIKNKQITVLLGHNGAGKTTTLNMIMGSVSKDSGKITVCSERDVASYRHLIGFCPQHSVFMPYMTCMQHLEFFAEVRGMSSKEAHMLATNLLSQLRLTEKEHEYGGNLSGGMKRRLSLGIAITGNTKVVVLDEPSSGLDIESRRELWDILLELRKNKAVLITTHHMEEAEMLGDTICILANGRLQCTGSPLELKHKLGRGYVLKLCMKDDSNQNGEDLLKEVQRFIPMAEILNFVKPTVHISLPYENKTEYKNVLKYLEANLGRLYLKSISISDVSMEDVFLSCVPEWDEVDAPKTNSTETSHVPYERIDAQNSWVHLAAAIFYKKFIFLINNWKFLMIMIALPLLSVLLALSLMRSPSVTDPADKLLLDLSQVKSGIVYIKSSGSNEILSTLKSEIEKRHIEVKDLDTTNETTDTLIQLQNENIAQFLQQVIGVIEVEQQGTGGVLFRIYFSGNVYHSSVILLNLVDNVILKLKNNAGKTIETTYAPIATLNTDISPTRLEYYAVIISIGMFFCMFFYVLLPFEENKNGFKQLQAVPRPLFWLSNFFFDACVHFIVCVGIFILQWLLMPAALYSSADQVLIVWSIFFYGVSYLPILYSLANAFHSISSISTYLLFMLIVSAIVALITSGNVRAMELYDTPITLLSLLPDFNLNNQLRIINERFTYLRRHSASTVLSLPSVLNVYRFFVFAIFVAIVVMIVLIVILENKYKLQALGEFFNCYKCRQTTAKNSTGIEGEEEGLMLQEKLMVNETLKEKREQEFPLLVSDLYKFYKHQAAVRGLSFAVRKGECFGLLGVNGAGKTSTFQMITANATISAGTVKIDGVDILRQEIEYRYRFGYCPQVDSLNDFMTAYQMLTYMAKLRGIVRPTDVRNEVMYWLEKLDLLKYRDVRIRFYSGGTKRKLSAAMAMIGSPSLVLLDEPTTGVDPASRRFLWRCIKNFQSRDKTVVLTSHSMDECEQLCNRLAIMANGKFRCLDYVPELKRQFSAGLTINIKVKASADTDQTVNRTTQQLQAMFPKCELRENHAGMLTYFIENVNGIEWSNIFKQLEKFHANSKDVVEDYSINEPTLEDIFLKFDMQNKRQAKREEPSLEEV